MRNGTKGSSAFAWRSPKRSWPSTLWATPWKSASDLAGSAAAPRLLAISATAARRTDAIARGTGLFLAFRSRAARRLWATASAADLLHLHQRVSLARSGSVYDPTSFAPEAPRFEFKKLSQKRATSSRRGSKTGRTSIRCEISRRLSRRESAAANCSPGTWSAGSIRSMNRNSPATSRTMAIPCCSATGFAAMD